MAIPPMPSAASPAVTSKPRVLIAAIPATAAITNLALRRKNRTADSAPYWPRCDRRSLLMPPMASTTRHSNQPSASQPMIPDQVAELLAGDDGDAEKYGPDPEYPDGEIDAQRQDGGIQNACGARGTGSAEDAIKCERHNRRNRPGREVGDRCQNQKRGPLTERNAAQARTAGQRFRHQLIEKPGLDAVEKHRNLPNRILRDHPDLRPLPIVDPLRDQWNCARRGADGGELLLIGRQAVILPPGGNPGLAASWRRPIPPCREVVAARGRVRRRASRARPPARHSGRDNGRPARNPGRPWL